MSGRRLGREERGRFRERGVGREGEFKEVRWEVKEGEWVEGGCGTEGSGIWIDPPPPPPPPPVSLQLYL